MKKQFDLRGNVITLTGLKKEIDAMENGLHSIKRIQQYQQETSGIVGGEEKTFTMMVMFGTYPVLEPEVLKESVNALAAKMQPELDINKFRELGPEMKDIFQKHVFKVDSRKTPEQVAAQNDQYKLLEIERAAKSEAEEVLVNLRGEGMVTIPTGMMAVIIGAYEDKSDIMTDYFNRHSQVGNSYCIGYVEEGARTQAKHREVINNIPELSSMEWNYQQKEYSMGHGTWMESGVVGVIKNSKEYDSPFWYEVKCIKSSQREYRKSRLFTDTPVRATYQGINASNTGITVRVNEAKQGVEICFPSKPAEEIISRIKTNGFRWSRFNKVWYAKLSDSKLAFANSIAGTSVQDETGAEAIDTAEQNAGIDNWAANNL